MEAEILGYDVLLYCQNPNSCTWLKPILKVIPYDVIGIVYKSGIYKDPIMHTFILGMSFMHGDLKPMWFTLDILAAWCPIPVSISPLCNGVEEEGLIYSKLCNHNGKCWLGADYDAAAECWLNRQEHTGFPESRADTEAFPSCLPLLL